MPFKFIWEFKPWETSGEKFICVTELKCIESPTAAARVHFNQNSNIIWSSQPVACQTKSICSKKQKRLNSDSSNSDLLFAETEIGAQILLHNFEICWDKFWDLFRFGFRFAVCWKRALLSSDFVAQFSQMNGPEREIGVICSGPSYVLLLFFSNIFFILFPSLKQTAFRRNF